MNATLPQKGAADPRALVAALPDDTFVVKAEASTYASMSERQFDRLVKRGVLPGPVANLGTQVRRWHLGTLRASLRRLVEVGAKSA